MNKSILTTICINLIIISKIFAIEQLPNDFLPTIEELKQNLKTQYENNLKINKQEHLIEKPTLWDVLSGINLNYKKELLTNRNTLSIGFNIMKLFSISRETKKYNFQLKKMIYKNRYQYEKHLQSLIIMLEELKKKVFSYNENCKIFELKEILFQIDEEKYKEGEITPSEFLKKKIIFEFDKARLNDMKQDLFLFKRKILLGNLTVN